MHHYLRAEDGRDKVKHRCTGTLLYVCCVSTVAVQSRAAFFTWSFIKRREWRPHAAAAAVGVTPTHSQTWLRLHIDIVAFVRSLSALLQQNRISSLYSCFTPLFQTRNLTKILLQKKRQKEIIASRAKWQLHHIPGRSSQ